MIDSTKLLNTKIEGLRLFITEKYHDDRGSFIRHWEKETFKSHGLNIDFVQDNISISNNNVIRGLHTQKEGFEQGKLVRALTGAFLDVAVDLRTGSKTYGHHCKIKLTSDNGYLFWIPPGFGHGFKSLINNSIFLYKCDSPYSPDNETGVIWNDSHLNIDWDVKKGDRIIVSEKDKSLPSFENYMLAYNSTKII